MSAPQSSPHENRLIHETSPYLLQHARNPVDWYAWGEEALARSRAEDKPIFLSVGYSACHWCHVMEHESFEDPEIAQALNQEFICIKVDREERPDLDQIYMNAVQLLTGRGGWPMSVFLTPQLQPFFGGTYWPPRPRHGMPGFLQVIHAVSDAWKNRREQAIEQAAGLTRYLQQMNMAAPETQPVDDPLLQAAAVKLEQAFDFRHGGFGQAPKFPHPMDLQVLLRVWQRTGKPRLLEMVQLTLDKMSRGGIYDHLAGGFARYSVDERWLVPHFEKMLYDNALLANAYLDGYLATGHSGYEQTVRETLDYVLRDMTDPAGGFHSTEDADSEGEEGKFYLWTLDEVLEVLGKERGERFAYVYDVTREGNFEGQNILNLPKPIAQCATLKHWDAADTARELAESRAALLQRRNARVRPGKDDKILVSWNALMIDALARAAAVWNDRRYLTAAQRATRFLLDNVRRADGRLLHAWRQGRARFDAYLDDYTYLIQALQTLYEADFEERWLEEAVRLADFVLAHFADEAHGGFFFTADDHETLLTRNKDFADGSVPSGNAMAATALGRLGRFLGRDDYLAAARRTLEAAAGIMTQSPTATGQLLLAVDDQLGPFYEFALLGDPGEAATQAALQGLRQRFIPRRVVACRNPQASPAANSPLEPLFQGKSPQGQTPTLFVCQNFSCQSPVAGRDAIEAAWERVKSEG